MAITSSLDDDRHDTVGDVDDDEDLASLRPRARVDRGRGS